MAEFDAFLCHNSADKEIVWQIYLELQRAGLNLWIDKEELSGGSIIDLEIENALRQSAAAIIFFGKNDLGKYQKEKELGMTHRRRLKEGEKFPILPIALPGGDLKMLTDRFEGFFYYQSDDPEFAQKLKTWIFEFARGIKEDTRKKSNAVPFPRDLMPPPKSHLLCDRKTQATRFRTTLMPSALPANPVGVFIHGPDDEKPSSLVERLRFEHFEEPKIPVPGVESGKSLATIEIDWAFSGSVEEQKKQLLANHQQVFQGEYEPTTFLERISSENGILLVKYSISGKDWNESTQKLLTWICNDFWKPGIGKSKVRIFLFFKLVYSEENLVKGGILSRWFGAKKHTLDSIQDEITEICKDSKLNCTDLGLLKEVSKEDVSGWLDQFSLNALRPDISSHLTNSLFPDVPEPRREAPMEKVEPILYEFINNIRNANSK